MCKAIAVTELLLPFPDIDPVAIRIGPLAIQWYAIMYLIAFAAGYFLMRRRLAHEPFRSISRPGPYTTTVVEDVLTAVILGVLLGGRLGYCLLYHPSYYLSRPLDIIKVWEGGMSFHGGAIGVLLAFCYYAWRHKRPMLQVADFVVPAAPLGLFFGRIGNFINGELWGREAPADLPWAMIFPTGGDVPRHPSQLYQGLMEGLLLFVILWLFARRKRYRGQVAGLFLAGYGIFRFIGEFFREPDSHLGYLGLGLTMGQWLSVPMIVAGCALIAWGAVRRIDDAEPESDEAAAPDTADAAEQDDPIERDETTGLAEPAGQAVAEANDEVSDAAADPSEPEAPADAR